MLALVALLIYPCCSMGDSNRASSSWQHIIGKQQLELEQAGLQAMRMRNLQQNADVPALNPYGGLKMEGKRAAVACVSASVACVITVGHQSSSTLHPCH